MNNPNPIVEESAEISTIQKVAANKDVTVPASAISASNNTANTINDQLLVSPDCFHSTFKISEIVSGSVRFCSNLDFNSQWANHLQALQQVIPSYLMCSSEKDLLSYTRKSIHGMTVPQLYIKVPGVWTGGHEENLR